MELLYTLTIHELQDLLAARTISSVEVTRAYLARIEAVEPRLHAFITRTDKLALAGAEAADRNFKEGRPQALTGIPIALKDIFLTEGILTTCASKILSNFVPPYTATSAERLLEQGAVLLGKLNMDEFAMGSSTETSFFGITKNPWDLERVPGGSSGGSAAAVAADLCAGTLGTDTGGSIRQPASLCGIVGIKPTYGRVSRYGVIAFASSLDQVGPMAKDVTDAAILLQVIAGRDPRDSTSLDIPVPDYRASMNGEVKGLKIGLPTEYFGKGCDAEVDQSVKAAARLLEKIGARVEEVTLPHTEYAVPTYYILAPAEASSNLARYDGIRFGWRAEGATDLIDLYKKTRTQGFGAEVKRRIMLGTYVLSAGYYDAYYLKAQKVRTIIRHDFEEVFKKVDVILTPVSPTPAWRIGEKTDDPLKMYLADIYTINVNLAGLPGLALPCGFSSGGLPIGMQLVGPPFKEEVLFRTAYAYERATEWHTRRPPL